MKTLTPKERREIYLKAAETFETAKWDTYGNVDAICHWLACLWKKDIHEWSMVVDAFSEFAMFKPNQYEGTCDRWWHNNDKGSRIICLLLCAEMTKTAKQ